MSRDTHAHRTVAAALFLLAVSTSLWASPTASSDPHGPTPSAPGSSPQDDDSGADGQQPSSPTDGFVSNLGNAGNKLMGIAGADQPDDDQESDDDSQQTPGATSGLVDVLGLVSNKYIGPGSHTRADSDDEQAPNSNIAPPWKSPNSSENTAIPANNALNQAFGSILGGVVGAGPNGDTAHPEQQLPNAGNNGAILLNDVLGSVSTSDTVHDITTGGRDILNGGRPDPAYPDHDDDSSDSRN